MKIRRLAVVLSILGLMSISGAQTPTPGVATDPRLTPVPATVATAERGAPWLTIDRSKQQYYVFRSYAPPELAAQLDRPIADPAYRTFLVKRAAALRSGSRTLRLAVNQDAIIDIGAERPEDANTVAFVELEKSPQLLQIVQTELGIDTEKNYVIPFLTSTYAREVGPKPAYRLHDRILVNVAAKDLSGVAVWRLADGQWQRLYQAGARPVSAQDRQKMLDSLQIRRGRLYYQGYSTLARAEATAQVQLIRPATMQDMEALRRQRAEANAAATSPTTPSPPAPPAPPAPPPSPPPAPQTYTAYGSSPWCRQYCSTGSCLGCCAQVIAAEQATIFGLSLACHLASDLCPWCHFGCAANTAVMSGVLTAHEATCIIGCTVKREVLASQGNPRHCPVH